METVECQRCKKPIADRRRGVLTSRQPFQWDETTGALVIVCAHYWLGGKCRERTIVSVTRAVAVV